MFSTEPGLKAVRFDVEEDDVVTEDLHSTPPPKRRSAQSRKTVRIDWDLVDDSTPVKTVVQRPSEPPRSAMGSLPAPSPLSGPPRSAMDSLPAPSPVSKPASAEPEEGGASRSERESTSEVVSEEKISVCDDVKSSAGAGVAVLPDPVLHGTNSPAPVTTAAPHSAPPASTEQAAPRSQVRRRVAAAQRRNTVKIPREVAADAVARAAERERYDSLEPPTKEIAKKGTSALTKSMAGGVALLAVLLALYFLYA